MAAAKARDWDGFGALLADDMTYHSDYLRFNAEGFAYDWHIAVPDTVNSADNADLVRISVGSCVAIRYSYRTHVDVFRSFGVGRWTWTGAPA